MCTDRSSLFEACTRSSYVCTCVSCTSRERVAQDAPSCSSWSVPKTRPTQRYAWTLRWQYVDMHSATTTYAPYEFNDKVEGDRSVPEGTAITE